LLTNYYGYPVFNDGDPSTAAEDYYYWELSIDDTNDSDGDTIPDFSDNPQVMTPSQPMLSLENRDTNLVLSISGDLNSLCKIQEISSLGSTNWITIMSVTLTNNPQTISLPLSSALANFWRVLVN
jgi:hypothetical protein